MQNEFQNAYQTSQQLQRERNHLDIPAGLVAVVEESLAYCQFTDATLPNPNRAVVKLYGSRRIADHVAKALNAKQQGEGFEGEVWYAVAPKLPVPAPMTDRRWEELTDEIPF
jgi:hypothetical protein